MKIDVLSLTFKYFYMTILNTRQIKNIHLVLTIITAGL